MFFDTPNLVRAIARMTGLVVSSQFFHEVKSDPNALVVAFYLANDEDEDIVRIRFKAIKGTKILFTEAVSVTVETGYYSGFNQKTKITITDDSEENYSVIAKLVAKLLKSK